MKKYKEAVTFQYMPKSQCCGCEGCYNVCPTGAIEMMPDEKGFLYPVCDYDKCIHCNRCVQVCPQLGSIKQQEEAPQVYAGFCNDSETVSSSSSGGFFTRIASIYERLHPDADIVAVVWSDDYHMTYHRFGKIGDLEAFKKSKYIQSRKGDIFKQIKLRLQEGKYILFVGCPCEVAGLTKFLGKEYNNLTTIDLVCQGPTSPKVMQEYITDLEKSHKGKISDVNLRFNGGKTWIPQWIKIRFENGKIYKRVFYETNLGIAVHFMQREACYSCQWNGNRRQSDITLGDFHGCDPKAVYYNADGTSIVIANTKKGQSLIRELIREKNTLCQVSYDEVVKHNPRVDSAWKPLKGSERFVSVYKDKGLKKAAFRSLTLKKKIKYLLPAFLSNIINKHNLF